MLSFLVRCCLLLVGGTFLLAGCIDSYPAPAGSTSQSYLVVDGFINSQGSTVIKLSRAFGLAASGAPPVETKATVAIRDNVGVSYALTEGAAGTYTSPVLTLNPTRQYQVRITTAKGRTYASDLEPVKTTPPIDQLTWRIDGPGLRIAVNTHDATNNTRYYRWDYVETWQYNSAFRSALEYVKTSNSIQPRTDNIYTCWRTENSTVIKQSNTTKLSQDVVADYPLIEMPFSEKLLVKYSVLVQQYAQTQAEYQYWELLSKNTQNIGTLNDPLPTQLTGNVHCLTDASEIVLGYVSAHSVTEKRIFIDYYDLKPRPLNISTFYDKCTTDTVYAYSATAIFRDGKYIPFETWYGPRGIIIGYFASTADCVDCRLRGTNVKPAYWP